MIINDKTIVFPGYVICTITAPTLGVLGGGILTHRVGGYENRNALNLWLVMGIMAMLWALPIPFVRSFWPFIILMWGLLFFGAGVMPTMTGVMISSVEPKHRYRANSLSQVVSNLLGYLPAPFFYGFVWSITGGDDSPYGMLVLLYWCIFAIIFAGIAMMSRKAQRSIDIDIETPLLHWNAN